MSAHQKPLARFRAISEVLSDIEQIPGGTESKRDGFTRKGGIRNLVMRESLDDTLHHLLPWDIELVIDEPVDEAEEEPEL